VATPSHPAQSPKSDLPTLHNFFSPNGVLSRTHENYEFRRGQLQMAQAVEEAMAEKRHLLVEAGTGTGKTLAYLMPILRSGKRVVISTGTKNLQEQLFLKDVPFLERALFGETGRLSVCYMKGRNNYLCRQKLADLTTQPILNGLEEISQFQAISDWEKTTETGDRSEIAGLPEASALWPKLDARAEACTGQKCPQFDRCFITEMRRRAVESDVVIVNHHLFFADLAIKQLADAAPDAGILPDYGAVVFDEAHELEDVAGSYFGITVSNLRFNDLVRDIETLLKMKGSFGTGIMSATKSVRERSQFFFSLLPPGDGRFAFDTRREFLEENGDEYIGLVNSLGRVTAELEALNPKPDEVLNFLRRVDELRVQLSFVMESQDRNTVYWIERRGDRSGRRISGNANVFLQASPIDVSQILRERLFNNLDTAVLTSATLAVSGGFDYLKSRLGVEHARELVVPSHFDYERQAILYVPPDMPDPRTPQFAGRATERIRRVLEITQGRAFCLFTSYAQMNEIHDR